MRLFKFVGSTGAVLNMANGSLKVSIRSGPRVFPVAVGSRISCADRGQLGSWQRRGGVRSS
jgi:hypothetical protein